MMHQKFSTTLKMKGIHYTGREVGRGILFSAQTEAEMACSGEDDPGRRF
jgi:hypothetical protein